MSLHVETPLIQSRALGLTSGRSVWLKLEALQPSGSFKLRGIGAACEAHARQGKKRLVSSSGGNAGIAVAYAGRQLGVPVTVVVPETTTQRARLLIEQEGAALVVHGSSWQEANGLALQMLEDTAAAFVHPFDDPVIWTGHSTMIDEAIASGVRFDAVVLSVGGGGLLAGVAEGLARHGLRCPIVAVETDGAASLARSVREGRRIELEAITSIATSLGAKMVCERAFDLARQGSVRCEVVSDRQALDACERFLDDHRLLVEPACGASLAVLYEPTAALEGIEAPLVIVCGGATADRAQLEAWRARVDAKVAPGLEARTGTTAGSASAPLQ